MSCFDTVLYLKWFKYQMLVKIHHSSLICVRMLPGGHGLHVALWFLKDVGAGVRGDRNVRCRDRCWAQIPHLILEQVVILVAPKVLCMLPDTATHTFNAKPARLSMLCDLKTKSLEIPGERLQVEAAHLIGELFWHALLQAGEQLGVRRPRGVVAEHAGFCCTAERQQEQSVCPDHLVGLHSGEGPRGLHLQRLFSRLLNLVGKTSRLGWSFTARKIILPLTVRGFFLAIF